MKNILITGAFGFVGANLSKAIKTAFNCNLIALDLKEPENHDYDSFYNWGVLEKVDWQQVDFIIHLAGKAHDTKNTAGEQTYFDVNVGLTKIIFDYFLKSKQRHYLKVLSRKTKLNPQVYQALFHHLYVQ